ncbi:MAG: FliM/FliN family flagellar motor switch protein, partial [Patulibacter sp.]
APPAPPAGEAAARTADDSADGDAMPPADGAGDAPAEDPVEPVRARRWSDRVAEASRQPAATAGDAVIGALARLVGLPPGAATTQAVYAESDAAVAEAVGPLPDAVVIPVQRDGVEVRLVLVVPGIVSARLAAAELEVGSAAGPGVAPVPVPEGAQQTDGEPPVEAADAQAPTPPALGGVPLDLAAEIGTTRMPLSSVLGLRDGAVVELAEPVDAPVALVAGSTTVAAGELELDDAGALVLHVTTIPGRPGLACRPSVVPDGGAATPPAGE